MNRKTFSALDIWASIGIGLFMMIIAAFAALSVSKVDHSVQLILQDAQFFLSEDGRQLELTLLNVGEERIQLNQINIDQQPHLTWSADRLSLDPNHASTIYIRNSFLPEKLHQMTIEINQGHQVQFEFSTPVIEKKLELSNIDISTMDAKLEMQFHLNSVGYDNLTFLAEPFYSYQSESMPIYVFEDEVLSDRSKKFLSALKQWLQRLVPQLNVEIVNRNQLQALAQTQAPMVLIMMTSLVGEAGITEDTLPVALLQNPQASQTGIEHLKQWLEKGLILITPISTHPLRNVLLNDGRVQSLATVPPGVAFTGKLNTWWSVSARPTQMSSASVALLQGRYQGQYGGIRELVEDAQMLYGYQELSNRFTKGPKEVIDQDLHLYNPFFLRVGQGGWLAMSSTPPQVDVLVRDLGMILLHSPWRGQWLESLNPAAVVSVQPRGGQVERTLTFQINLSRLPAPQLIRLLAFVEDEDQQKTLHREWIFSLEANQ